MDYLRSNYPLGFGNGLLGLGILRSHKIFISHVWRETGFDSEYYRLVNMLNNQPNFYWQNYSVAQHAPLPTTTNQELSLALADRISRISCFLVIAGMYVSHRNWIDHEIRLAILYRKPIIAISPWGQERHPQDLMNVSREFVGWNGASIVGAINRYSLA